MRRVAYGSSAWGLMVVALGPAAHGQTAPASQPAEVDAEPPGSFFLRREPLTEPLVTDRPDFTESTDAVPSGYVQLEMGYTFTYDREGEHRVRSHTMPEMLWRIGLFENFELRIGWEGYTFEEFHTQTESERGRPILRETWSQGASDLSLGFKYKFCEQDGLVPHFGVIAAITVPSGSAEFSSGDVDPELKLLWAYDLTERLSVAGNVNLAVPTEEGERFFQTSASVSGAVSITDRLGSYVEYFGFYPASRYTDCAHYLNGGFTYLVTDNFQVDLRAGIGLNEEADDFFTGIGFAWRF